MTERGDMADWDSVDQILWIDEMCDRFEDACRAERSISLVEFLRRGEPAPLLSVVDPDNGDV